MKTVLQIELLRPSLLSYLGRVLPSSALPTLLAAAVAAITTAAVEPVLVLVLLAGRDLRHRGACAICGLGARWRRKMGGGEKRGDEEGGGE